LTLYSVYGVTLETDFDFSWPLTFGSPPADVCFEVRPGGAESDLNTTEPLFRIPASSENDDFTLSFYRTGLAMAAIRFATDADYYLRHDRIVCYPHKPGQEWLVEIQLLGIVLGLWLELRGVPTLHASAAVVDGCAVAVLGAKGEGKTTLITALTAAGHPLLVDDLLALEVREKEVVAHPGYPMLRLWPEQADYFLGHHASLPLVHPRFTKRRVTVGGSFGVHHPYLAPLTHVYLPERSDCEQPAIERVATRDALIALMRHSFLREAIHPFNLAGPRLATFAELIRHVSVRRLVYPPGFERLPELVAAIESDVNA
jgi:hypothetical protein